jgi:hypothetical protein
MRPGFSQGFDTGAAPRAGEHPNDPARNELVELVLNIIQEREKSLIVCGTGPDDVNQSLPLSLIEIEPTRSMGPRGVTARVKLPRWLAREKGLIAGFGEGQGELQL